ncbi:MAG: hypothetical protein MZU79_00775 [Anaerotruncus sp.]|nr:hypothetical protein [Anaerotruncus sp.]
MDDRIEAIREQFPAVTATGLLQPWHDQPATQAGTGAPACTRAGVLSRRTAGRGHQGTPAGRVQRGAGQARRNHRRRGPLNRACREHDRGDQRGTAGPSLAAR